MFSWKVALIYFFSLSQSLRFASQNFLPPCGCSFETKNVTFASSPIVKAMNISCTQHFPLIFLLRLIRSNSKNFFPCIGYLNSFSESYKLSWKFIWFHSTLASARELSFHFSSPLAEALRWDKMKIRHLYGNVISWNRTHLLEESERGRVSVIIQFSSSDFMPGTK